MLLPHEHRHAHHSVLFKPGFGPFPVTDKDPSFSTCYRHFAASEYAIWATTTLVPSYLGYRVTGTFCRRLAFLHCPKGRFGIQPFCLGCCQAPLPDLCLHTPDHTVPAFVPCVTSNCRPPGWIHAV
jgi:hypothetical protein